MSSDKELMGSDLFQIPQIPIQIGKWSPLKPHLLSHRTQRICSHTFVADRTGTPLQRSYVHVSTGTVRAKSTMRPLLIIMFKYTSMDALSDLELGNCWHFKLFVTFYGLFLSSFCGVAAHIDLLVLCMSPYLTPQDILRFKANIQSMWCLIHQQKCPLDLNIIVICSTTIVSWCQKKSCIQNNPNDHFINYTLFETIGALFI